MSDYRLNIDMYKLKAILIFILLVGLSSSCIKERANDDSEVNVLVIVVDQLSAEVMSNAGCEWVETPSMDKLAEEGVKFTNAYTSFPLCSPTRASFLTGKYPSQSHHNVMQYASFATILKEQDYQTEYIGKWHVGTTRIAKNQEVKAWSGFEEYSNGDDNYIQKKTVEFLEEKHSKPFLLFTSFMNPHDCCELARKIGGWDTRNTFEKGNCVPDLTLPDDHSHLYPHTLEDPTMIPEVMRNQQPLPGKNYVSIRPTGGWNKEDWAQYRHGYAQLVECVDKRIGAIMATLKEQELLDRTVVIFTSDHGDGLGEHGWNQKLAFYDEIIKVPLIISAPNGKKGEVSNKLVNIGIDLFPTVLDFSGISADNAPGQSLLGVVTGKDEKLDRDFIISELDLSLQGLGTAKVPEGKDLDRLLRYEKAKARMITDGRFKYIRYNMGDDPEMMFDLKEDPHETTNLIMNDQYADQINIMRNKLKDHLVSIGDDF